MDPKTAEYGAPERATKYTYDLATQKWFEVPITISMGKTQMAEGTNRIVFPAKDLSKKGDAQYAVAKCAKAAPSRKDYFADVVQQAKCADFAKQFNARNPPKKVTFLEASVIELVERPHDATGGCPLYNMEPMLGGLYRKHSNNFGFVDTEERNTPQAFSHFTFHVSNGSCIVVDIQGVGDTYTDPQIHSNIPCEAPPVYGQGDMACEGIKKFFESHKCNFLCDYLGISGTQKKMGDSGTRVQKGPPSSGEAHRDYFGNMPGNGSLGKSTASKGNSVASSVGESTGSAIPSPSISPRVPGPAPAALAPATTAVVAAPAPTTTSVPTPAVTPNMRPASIKTAVSHAPPLGSHPSYGPPSWGSGYVHSAPSSPIKPYSPGAPGITSTPSSPYRSVAPPMGSYSALPSGPFGVKPSWTTGSWGAARGLSTLS